ncbi:DNA mismatch repair protein MutS [Gramella sp. AN32]|uniref:DNA mismatch repair protein MutS n=1 Tax=Christiangramia antarctica TaxID=2058158 RepID=A0ABW5XAM1_9FLAO|nr:DNA mismatch repair protein MutS [Gramella sp. AN32]MCM4155449.1 DNA mismatch repair protein MutS [Gramella sp. AN32]
MTQAKDFYISRKEQYSQKYSELTSRLAFSSIFRLLNFLLIGVAIYYFFGNIQLLILVVVVMLVLFLFLVSRHSNIKAERERILALQQINEQELRILNTRDFSDLPEGKEFEPAHHEFSQDIDLFGKKSFFQYLNRTALKGGSARLASMLLSNDVEAIIEKQKSVKELSEKADWRQNFTATASLIKTRIRSTIVIDWIKNYKSFVPKFGKWLPNIFSVVSISIIIAAYFELVPGSFTIIWLFVGIGITTLYLKKVNDLSEKTGQVQETFQQYYQLIGFIEKEEFESAILVEIKNSIITNTEKASEVLHKFSKALDALDQRNNYLFGFIVNGFFLWDIRYAYAIEKWIEQYQESVEKWFTAVEKIDAYNSLGNFSFNHDSYIFPQILEKNKGIQAKNLGHPLLDPSKRIDNDFQIDSEQFFIITGANMAGKSTFLRTVALQILMSNTGLPVCADSGNYSPIKLITSMRTTDSLGDDESYFFSELKRLKFIVNKIEDENYFIILDEILKGTNSTDKAIGSRKFVQRLVASHSTGIIATHDLSLCEISEELKEVKNFYFDAEIVNDELHFDYHLKNGICQNMNASFLLRKMKIVEE